MNSPSSSLAARRCCLCSLGLFLALTGCSVGPNYVQPSAPVPDHYKDSGNWKPANPQDAVVRGNWWEIYHDPQLNALEEKVNLSNQNVLQAEATFREAAAAVKVARAAYYPTVSSNPSLNESQTQSLFGPTSSNVESGTSVISGTGASGTGTGMTGTGTTGTGTTGTGTTGTGTTGTGIVATSGSRGGSNEPVGVYDLPLQVSYLADVWGSVRRNVEANSATAQASFADLENARLSYQGTLAQDYFSLRGLDAQAKLLGDTVASYQTYLKLTNNRYASGIASRGDVAQAETQLEGTQAQLIDVGVQRAQYEHAIAMLIGEPASIFGLRSKPLTAEPPRVPAGVPSTLLERRPDIAGAERRMAAANAEIGVQVAGYYPQLTLTGSAGLETIEAASVFSGPNFLWSVGPAVAQTIFDAGRTHGLVQEARATYDSTVATYRETVLTAFEQIEDDLSGLRILESEAEVEGRAVQSAQKSLDVETNLYKAGTVDYLQVITTQAILLNDQVTDVNIRTRRMTTSVLLVEALGGGWKKLQLPGKRDVADVPQADQDINETKTAAPTLRTPPAQLR